MNRVINNGTIVVSSLPPHYLSILLSTNDTVSFERSYSSPFVKNKNFKTSASNISISNTTVAISYLHPVIYLFFTHPTIQSHLQIFKETPASIIIASMYGLGFLSVFFHCHTKATPRNCYLQDPKLEKNSNAFFLSSRVSFVFWWTYMVNVNLNADCWRATHLCVNHTFPCYWWTSRWEKPGTLNFQIIRGFIRGKKTSYGFQFIVQLVHVTVLPWVLYFAVVGNFLKCWFTSTKFMFGCYKSYTDILSNLFLISCVIHLNIQPKTSLKGLTFSLGEPPKSA